MNKNTKLNTQRRPNHFGDARDKHDTPSAAGCTSANSFSTMPRRQR